MPLTIPNWLAALSALWISTLTPAVLAGEDAADDENDGVQASPDVRAQVGMGTEKETLERGTPTKSPGDEDPARTAAAAKSYGHRGQFGIRAGVSAGYEILIQYDDSPSCGFNDNGDEKVVCAHVAPGAFDLAFSYALLDSLEPYFWLRFGLGDQPETHTAATSLYGLGLRIYTLNESQLKLYFEPALALSTEGAIAGALPNDNYDTDYVVHLHFGLQYDFLRQLGLYVSAGPNVTFVRAIGTEIEGSIGLQARLP